MRNDNAVDTLGHVAGWSRRLAPWSSPHPSATRTPARWIAGGAFAFLAFAPIADALWSEPTPTAAVTASAISPATPEAPVRSNEDAAARSEPRAEQPAAKPAEQKPAAPAAPAQPAPPATPAAPAAPPASAPAKAPAKAAPVAGLSQAQMDNAAVIVRTGQKAGLPKRAYVIAVATAMQESKLLNLANPTVPQSLHAKSQGMGWDHDSVGLFQQRPSAGWGAPAQLLDPEYAAGKFYAGLVQVPGWGSIPLTVAAQSVQVSAFPDAYAQHESTAQRVVDALTK